MNRKTKWSQRILALAMAAMMCCSVFPIGAFAETLSPQESTVIAEEQQTVETETDSGQTDASSPDPGADAEEAPEPSEAQTEERPEEKTPEEENTEEPPAENASEDAESVIEQPAQEALFISSRAFWYLPIFSFISPLPKPMNSATNAKMIPTREARPNRQSNAIGKQLIVRVLHDKICFPDPPFAWDHTVLV